MKPFEKILEPRWLVTTAAGAVIGAIIVYQLRKHTSGIVDD